MLTGCAVLDTTQASEAAAAAAQKKAAEFEGVSIEVGGGAGSLLKASAHHSTLTRCHANKLCYCAAMPTDTARGC